MNQNSITQVALPRFDGKIIQYFSNYHISYMILHNIIHIYLIVLKYMYKCMSTNSNLYTLVSRLITNNNKKINK